MKNTAALKQQVLQVHYYDSLIQSDYERNKGQITYKKI